MNQLMVSKFKYKAYFCIQLGRIVYVHPEAINLYKNNLIVGIETNEKLMTIFLFCRKKILRSSFIRSLSSYCVHLNHGHN